MLQAKNDQVGDQASGERVVDFRSLVDDTI